MTIQVNIKICNLIDFIFFQTKQKEQQKINSFIIIFDIVKPNNYTPWLRYLGLTAQLLVLIGAAVYAGITLDKKLHVSPLFTIFLPLLVLGVTFYKLIKDTNKKKDDEYIGK